MLGFFTPSILATDYSSLPPLQQIKLGIAPDEIQCRDFLILITKHDGSFVCIKPDTLPKLIERNWAWSVNCYPDKLSPNQAEFYVNLPDVYQVLPSYKLQAVDQTDSGIMLYYSDESLCSIRGGPLEETLHGTVVVEITKNVVEMNNAEWTEQTFQNLLDDAIFYEPQILTVNDQSAVGWEPYYGQSIATLNEDIIHHEDIPWPGRVLFYDEQYHLSYNIMGTQPLEELHKITKTLQHEKESESTFLSKSLTEWKNMTPVKLEKFSEKYGGGDDFDLELGKFLIKEEMKDEIERQNLQNRNDDFVVYSGMSSMSIGFSAVVNATDQNTYFLQGSVNGNRIDNDVSIRPLIFYPDILDSSKTSESNNNSSQRIKPYEKLLDMEPKITISKGEITDIYGRYFVNGSPHELILNLDKNDMVSFYNNLDVPIRIIVEEKEKINENSELKENNPVKDWKTGTIMQQKTGTIKIENIGQYELQVMMFSPVSEDNSKGVWETVGNVGQITVISKETKNIPLGEKLEIARPFMFHAHEDIPWYTLSSGHGQYVEMYLPKSIHKMIPDSKEYYEKRAQEWIPFEVPIKIR